MLKQVVCVVTSVIYRDVYTQQKERKNFVKFRAVQLKLISCSTFLWFGSHTKECCNPFMPQDLRGYQN